MVTKEVGSLTSGSTKPERDVFRRDPSRRVAVAPSILSSDFARLADEVGRVSSADLLHVDVMDGHFVPNITIGPPVVKSLAKATDLPLDVHLMIEHPERYVEEFASAGAAVITVHAEATRHLHRLLSQVKGTGARAGVALNPATPVEALRYVVDMVDLVLIMTVNPGFGGQGFIEGMYSKISEVRRLLDSVGSGAELEVDGGITEATGPKAAEAGATILVAGSYVFGAADPALAVETLRTECEKTL